MLKHLDELGIKDFRAMDASFAETNAGNMGMKGVEMTTERSSQAYQDVMKVLEDASVGRAKGGMDRQIVADAFFGNAEAGVAPNLASMDKGIYNRLAKIAGHDPAKLGMSVPEAFPNGFPVTINGRTIRVQPLRRN